MTWISFEQHFLCLFRGIQDQKNQLLGEVDILENQLRDEQEDNDDKTEMVAKLERDLRDMRVQLEQKIELGKKFNPFTHTTNAQQKTLKSCRQK